VSPSHVCSTLSPYTTLFRSAIGDCHRAVLGSIRSDVDRPAGTVRLVAGEGAALQGQVPLFGPDRTTLIRCQENIHVPVRECQSRSEEHMSELQSRGHLVCRL